MRAKQISDFRLEEISKFQQKIRLQFLSAIIRKFVLMRPQRNAEQYCDSKNIL
jgi:hypothetical protein